MFLFVRSSFPVFCLQSVLESHTYHADSLVTFSDVYKVHDDIKMARELIG